MQSTPSPDACPISLDAEVGVVIDLLLSYRAVEATTR